MAFSFPNSPTVGQAANGYIWDGEKWTAPTLFPGASNANPLANGAVAPGTSSAYSRSDHVHPPDPSKMNLAGNQTTTGGFAVTPPQLSASSSFTLNPMLGNYQWIQNVGAFTISAPTVDCAVDLMVKNGAGAGAISLSGFTVGSTGDALTVTNGSIFIISIRRIAGVSTYVVKALQ